KHPFWKLPILMKSVHGYVAAVATVIASGLALSSAACGAGAAEGPAPATATTADASLKPGTQATDLAARDIDGKTVRLSDYLAKQAVLLDFWSTFCEPCLAE